MRTFLQVFHRGNALVAASADFDLDLQACAGRGSRCSCRCLPHGGTCHRRSCHRTGSRPWQRRRTAWQRPDSSGCCGKPGDIVPHHLPEPEQHRDRDPRRNAAMNSSTLTLDSRPWWQAIQRTESSVPVTSTPEGKTTVFRFRVAALWQATH